MEISQILKTKRKELSLTQEQVAKKIFVSQKSVSNWENGKTYPDIESLIRLAHLYHLSLDNLLLEGSEMVNDIKQKSEIHKQRWLIFLPLIANCYLIFNFFNQFWQAQSSFPMIIKLSICLFLNIIPIVYFQRKSDNKETKVQHLAKIFLITIIAFLILGIVTRLLNKM